ncbi:hypothetical protein ACHQM5_007665 [Ranunculus cassubicifolius]
MGEEEKKVEEVKKSEGEEKKTEEKKTEEKKPEEKKPEESKPEEKKTEEESKEASPPPPPEEIVLRVFMHCEGCARKVKKCLRGFQGVEDVQTDCKTHKVVVKGKTADPMKVYERVQKKSHRKVELLSPIPKPPEEDAKKAEDEKENVKPEEKKEEPKVITALLKVHMHCEACAFEIQKRIMRMKGVESAEPDLKSSQVAVKGIFDPPKLVEYVYKRTGKHATLVNTEPEKKDEDKGKDDKKGDGEKEKTDGEKKDDKNEGEEGKSKGEEGAKVELVKNEFYYYPLKYNMEFAYPPQIFSDENPNACAVM